MHGVHNLEEKAFLGTYVHKNLSDAFTELARERKMTKAVMIEDMVVRYLKNKKRLPGGVIHLRRINYSEAA